MFVLPTYEPVTRLTHIRRLVYQNNSLHHYAPTTGVNVNFLLLSLCTRPGRIRSILSSSRWGVWFTSRMITTRNGAPGQCQFLVFLITHGPPDSGHVGSPNGSASWAQVYGQHAKCHSRAFIRLGWRIVGSRVGMMGHLRSARGRPAYQESTAQSPREPYMIWSESYHEAPNPQRLR
jgi:hypothetical protein